MFSEKKLRLPLSGKLLSVAVTLLLPTAIFFGAMFMLLPLTSAHEPIQPSQSTSQNYPLWTAPIYAYPGEGRGLWALTGEISNSCDKVYFSGMNFGVVIPTIEGGYNPDLGIYQVYIPGFFGTDTSTEVGTLRAACKLSNGNLLATKPIIFWRYYYDGGDITLPSMDGQAILILTSTSLISSSPIIVMNGNALPGPLPAGVTAVGLPYSFLAYRDISDSDETMVLNLIYQDLLNEPGPLTLSILEWDGTQWNFSEDQGLSISGELGLNRTTTKFTTYILARTPRWVDSFTSNIGLSFVENINLITVTGKLNLNNSVLTGTALSTPYTPKGVGCKEQIQAWQSVSYTADITPGTSMTVSVLSEDSQMLLPNVTSGQSLSSINPISYPGLRLRVDMLTSAPGISPELFDWSILADLGPYEVCLPIIFKQ